MAGRLHGEGSIYREGDYWVASVEAGRDPVTGRRVRRKLKARTKRELVARMAEVRQQLETGSGGRATSVTVGEFLHRWLDDVVAPRVESANTVHNYRSVVTAHIVPSLGSVRLTKLTPEMVDQFLASRARAGLSRSYVGRMRAVLTSALRHAERRSLVSRNAAALAVMPRCEPTASRRSLTVDEARALIGAAAGERLGALVVCGLALGLRPGELTGLLWTDLQLEAERPQLSVSGSMKRRPDSSLYRGPVKRSKAGERTVALPAVVVIALLAHRSRQDKERSDGGYWDDHGLVFCSEVGTPLDPSNVRKVFARVAARAGIEGVVPYSLRHTAASLLIDQGVGIEVVADLLGDDPRTLYRHYRHRVRPVVEAAAGPMQSLLGD
jgi:integrase